MTEVVPMRKVTMADLIKFVKHHVITASVHLTELSMVMAPSSPVKVLLDFAISSGSMISLLRLRTQQLMDWLELSTKLL